MPTHTGPGLHQNLVATGFMVFKAPKGQVNHSAFVITAEQNIAASTQKHKSSLGKFFGRFNRPG